MRRVRTRTPRPGISEASPFTVDGITFAIQDESGRARVPELDGTAFEQLLVGLEVAPERARQLVRELMEMQGGVVRTRALDEAEAVGGPGDGRLYPLQDLRQLRLLPSMDPELFARLRPLLTLYPTPGFNPLTAPAALLAARLSGSEAKGWPMPA